MAGESAYLDEAFELLDSVRNKPQSLHERKRLSLDLAALMLRESIRTMTYREKFLQEQLARLMNDPLGKAFTTALTDECFRSSNPKRIADQMTYLLHRFGIPGYLDWIKKTELFLFRSLGPQLSRYLVPLATHSLRKEVASVILPGERKPLTEHIQKRINQGVRLNLNHLGEAILSESEAKKRLQTYIDDLSHPNIDYISVKISTIFSQINLIDFEGSVDAIAERLRLLYRSAIKLPTQDEKGTVKHRFINLDMEEYRDLHLTVAAFRKVLDEPEFFEYSAGIVLQAYLPDSFEVQKNLTEWAKKRVENGGAPIKIRIVKGANLAMEQCEAALRGWEMAPYTSKVEVDANYKKMLLYGCVAHNARAVRLGIASHNLFDIAFAMLLRAENGAEAYVSFEMLEGMADHVRRVVHKLSGEMLLYCPIATEQEFQHAIAYLIRRLDENTGPENFLRHIFDLRPGSETWDAQTALFAQSCEEIESAADTPRRSQNRLLYKEEPPLHTPFENEPDTDFSLEQNRRWALDILSKCKNTQIDPIPIVVGGQEKLLNQEGIGISPSSPQKELYRFAKAQANELEIALECAKKHQSIWASSSFEHRSNLLAGVAQKLRERRGELIASMVIDGGKTIFESDPEVSEAVDFAEYYRRQMAKILEMKDIEWEAKGTVLVASPWNFPCAIPIGGISAALIAGNTVLFKPSSDVVHVGWQIANAFWDAGIPKEVLQFIPCSGETSGSELIADPRLDAVILTGGTSTALKMLSLRPGLDLAAETGGKNALIITALADRDLAIKDLVQSAFGHNGQKCSAASLAILEAELYDDPHFLHQLKEAVASLPVGASWNPSTKISPLIHPPQGALLKGLTSLEDQEKWLLEPKQDPDNPHLWSPGIKIGVQEGSFTHQTELFGPILGVMRAEHLQHAIHLANATPYGLTSGIHTLDEREQTEWLEKIEAGNCYINRGITGAIVRRQPFGGTKASGFGNGSKAGGPNYLREFLRAKQVGIPQEKYPVNEWVNSLTAFLEKIDLTTEQLGIWYASTASYAYWWKRMSQDRDPSKILGQDNLFRYVPRKKITLRIHKQSDPLDALRVCAAALTVGADLEISYSKRTSQTIQLDWLDLVPMLRVANEEEDAFYKRVQEGNIQRIRLTESPSDSLKQAAAQLGVLLIDAPILVNGRLELLHYLREVSISHDYHRYGNLGLRENELRKPIL